jgi:trigger factor
MKTKVTERPDSRVRVEAEVDSADVESRIKATAERLGKEMKISGFREGKVPPEMVVQKLGREAVLGQALESALAEWYERALLDAGINPVGDPQLELPQLPDEGEPLKFSFEVAVRPKAKLGDYKGLEVGRAEPEVPDDLVETELERLREGFAKLNPVDRAAKDGDVLVIDFKGEVDGEEFEGGEAKDYLLELGSGRVLPGFEEALKGANAGDEREAEVKFPDDYQEEKLAGKTAKFTIKVKEVREKELPELDDDFASEASEFDTLQELREEIAKRIMEVLQGRAEEQFREAALDVAVDKAKVDIPDDVVKARAEEMWQRVERRLQERGMTADSYLQMQGKNRDQIVEEAKPEAAQALKREAVLEAVAEAEGAKVSDNEMLEALEPPPGHEDHDHPEPKELLKRLKETGRDALLETDLRMRKALDAIVSAAKPIELEKAQAREQIWTPEKEREKKGSLWTPGSE